MKYKVGDYLTGWDVPQVLPQPAYCPVFLIVDIRDGTYVILEPDEDDPSGFSLAYYNGAEYFESNFRVLTKSEVLEAKLLGLPVPAAAGGA
jgi:hypothetical protein